MDKSTYSSTISFSQPSSLAMAEYRSLYAFATDCACSKHDLGNRLGKSVTGAVVANARDGSPSGGTNDGAGLTANPWAIDQSFKLVSRYFFCSSLRSGGYAG